ncbi:MAG: biopolymer transporter ExbD [Magnetococcales bacterium]|nr:biopolymer transporter ExbD [Magnetococcales bacterium]
MAGGVLKNSDPDQPLSEINVTPLVDVMLVLLVIFIIAAPLMAKALKVDLPQVAAPNDAEIIVVNLTVFAGGELELDNQHVAMDQLPHLLTQRFIEEPDAVLRLGSDGRTPYATIAHVLSIAQQNGIQRIAFSTSPPSSSPAQEQE